MILRYMTIVAVAAVFLVVTAINVRAGETPAWMTGDPDTDAKITAWFHTAVVQACCSLSDAYEADEYESVDGHYVAVITDGSANMWRREIPNGTKFVIQDDRIKFTNPPNPTGHGVLFVRMYPKEMGDPPHVFCFFPPSGG